MFTFSFKRRSTVEISEDVHILLEAINGYRRAFLLNVMHNKVFGSIFIPAAKLVAICATYVAIVGLVIFKNSMGTVLAVCLTVYLLALFILLVAGSILMSQVYYKSKTFHEEMTKFVSTMSNSKQNEVIYAKKVIKSLPILKSQIGSFYYMENQAKLTLLDNVVNGIVCMLISFK